MIKNNLANNIDALLDFHKSHGKMVTVTAVRPVARFGEITIEGKYVKVFKEKPQVAQGWINGGFFVAQYKFFDFIKGDSTILEKDPLEAATKKNYYTLFCIKVFGSAWTQNVIKTI